MRDPIVDDLFEIIKDKKLLPDFLKIDDTEDMYNMCKEHNNTEEQYYTKEEFEKQIENILYLLEKEQSDSSEW